MKIDVNTLLATFVDVSIGDDANPCGSIRVDDIEVDQRVRVIWRLPATKGYRFSGAGVNGLGGVDFEDGRFEDIGRRRFGWTVRRPGSQVWRLYSIAIEWVDDQGILRSCTTEPSLKIVNKS